MPISDGKLNQNKIYKIFTNMVLKIYVNGDIIKNTDAELLNDIREDVSLLGDKIKYRDFDILPRREWGGDAESVNLTKNYRLQHEKEFDLNIDQYSYFALTTDAYLSKNAFMSDRSFAEFQSALLNCIKSSKECFESTDYNAFIGTAKGLGSVKEISITNDGMLAQRMSEGLANLWVELKRPTTKFNGYGYRRSYKDADIKVVWNAAYMNSITSISLPVLFSTPEGLKAKFSQYVWSPDFFGTMNAVSKKTADENTRYAVGVTDNIGTENEVVHLAGDPVTVGTTIADSTKILIPTYQVDPTIACQVLVDNPVPYVTQFEIANDFANPASLNTTHRVIYAHNTLEVLPGRPVVTVKVAQA